MNSQTTTDDTLPSTGFVRQPDLVGVTAVTPEQAQANRKRGKGPKRPRIGQRGLLPFSDSTLWRKVQRNEFPAPVKISTRVTAWRVEDVRRWMEERGRG